MNVESTESTESTENAENAENADAGELSAERAYLRRGLRALRGMHKQARDTDIPGGDPVVDKATIAALRADKARRLATFTAHDDAVPLFFGRLDYRTGESSAVPAQPVYLGRRHVREDAGDDPLVVDWRAGVARPFYRAHRADPMDVRVRRRFGFVDGELTAFEDEMFQHGDAGSAGTGGTGGAGEGVTSGESLLEQEIQRPRSGPMRDIVATIQPEQDEIVRAELEVSICVQGAPGTGKTAVGLHRAAYLLYTYRERLRRSGVLVVGPNRAFLGYIAAVLPTLGEFTVEQRSVGDLLDGTPVRAMDPDDVAALKGDERMAVVIHRALHGAIGDVAGPVTVVAREGRWTVGADDVADLLRATRSGAFGYGAGRAMFARRIAAAAARRAELAGTHISDGGIETLARGRAVRDAVEAIWPKADGAKLVRRLLTDPPFLAAAADGVLTRAEQTLLLDAHAASRARAARWSLADAYCVDEARHLVERVPGHGHVIVDEAQDLSPMQCRAIGRRCADGSLTVLGDLAQGTTAWAASSWETTLGHLGKPAAHLEVLERSHRVPAQVLEFANRLLPHIAASVPAATSVRSVAGALTVVRAASGTLAAEVAAQARRVLAHEGSTAVVVPDGRTAVIGAALRDAGLPFAELTGDTAPQRVSLVPASLAKGLEFDHVVLADPAAVIEGEPLRTHGLRRLYVALTRTVTSLVVVAVGDLPAELAELAGLVEPAGPGGGRLP
ncbi:HelD family protein [Parafrankia elaeagni]|uniref:HelD family protein n=1 Tax=Parafrankia elaeagni TaxID=222534 RepID=UPI000377DF9E|nr:AAA family ATPase [Parafrankia elaeagni]